MASQISRCQVSKWTNPDIFLVDTDDLNLSSPSSRPSRYIFPNQSLSPSLWVLPLCWFNFKLLAGKRHQAFNSILSQSWNHYYMYLCLSEAIGFTVNIRIHTHIPLDKTWGVFFLDAQHKPIGKRNACTRISKLPIQTARTKARYLNVSSLQRRLGW